MKEELSIDNLDAEIKTNRELYEQLNKITEIEAVNPYDSQENEISNVVQEQKFFSEYITRLKRIYNDNDLFRYALWSIVLMLFSTTILTIVEYEMFKSDVSGDIDGSFKFGKSEPNWLDTFFHTFWWSVVTFTTVGYGDVSPVTPLGKIIGAFTAIMGVCTVALLTGIVASAFANQRAQRAAIFEAELNEALSDGFISDDEAKKIVESQNMTYIANKCIKQEYQRLFLKMSPVFPALKTD